jgi:hypothetical protein
VVAAVYAAVYVAVVEAVYKVGVQPWLRYYLGFASSFWRRYNPLWLLIRVTR